MKKNKFKNGQTITFKYLSAMCGKYLRLSGTIMGFGPEIRKRWPHECGECPDYYLLVRHFNVHGQDFWHVVVPEDVVEEPKCK